MRSLRLKATEIDTTILGFGCAGLYRLPRARERRAVLDAAYDTGIRHFDTAPMYGLGMAESELAPFLRDKRQHVTLTTKFGIDPTMVGRAMGRLQAPVRAVLQRRPDVGSRLKTAGRGPTTGWVGSLLYSSAPTGIDAARSSLERSLRALGTDYIDIFELHDPVGRIGPGVTELAVYLDRQRELGTIRCWGVTGSDRTFPGVARELLDPAPLFQYRNDAFDVGTTPPPRSQKPVVSFGILERALPIFRRFFDTFPEQRSAWSERLGLDGAEGTLGELLVRDALHRQCSGPVLFTSSRIDRVRAAGHQAELVTGSGRAGESAGVAELVSLIRDRFPEWVCPT